MAEGSERSLKMLAAALEKEEKGRDFYIQAAGKCSNELGKEIFRTLTADEGVHITRIKQIYSALQAGNAWSKDWQAYRTGNEDLQKLLRERARKLGPKVKSDTNDLEAVDIGIEMEQSAVSFYADQQTKATDALEKDFIVQMLAEERSHLRALEDIRLFFTDPDAWYIEVERHGLDGA
jgi:rubrerythrin